MVIIETDCSVSYTDPVVYHSYKFHSKIQQPDEPFDEYLSAITELAKLCEFESLEERMIRDKIVVGINCSSLRERLLQLKDTKLKNVVEYCRSVEKGKKKGSKDDVKKLLRFRKHNEEKTPEKKTVFEVNLEDSSNEDKNFIENVPGGSVDDSADGVRFVDVKMEENEAALAGLADVKEDSSDAIVDVNVKKEVVEEDPDPDPDYKPDSMDQDESFNNDDMIDISTNIKTEPVAEGESELFDCEMPGEGTPPELISDDEDERPIIIPPRSRERYTQGFVNFVKWQKETNRENLYTEDVLLNYFVHLSATFSPNTLWANFSMLTKMLKIKRNISIKHYRKLTAFIKNKNKGYKSRKAKVFKTEEIVRFLNEAPDNEYLHCKAVTVFGIIGACRTSEMVSIRLSDVELHGRMILVTIPATDTHIARAFTVSSDYYDIVKKYIDVRPKKLSCDRFFLQYRNGKCRNQPIGKNTFSRMPEAIAKFLNLEDAKEYTGHSFRSSSKKLLANTGADVFTLKRHGYRGFSDLTETTENETSDVKKEIENVATGTEDLIPLSPTTLETSVVVSTSRADEVIKEGNTSQTTGKSLLKTYSKAALQSAVVSSQVTPKMPEFVDVNKMTDITSESTPKISNPRSLNKVEFVATDSRVIGAEITKKSGFPSTAMQKPVFVVKTRTADRNPTKSTQPQKSNPCKLIPLIRPNHLSTQSSKSVSKPVFVVKTKAADRKLQQQKTNITPKVIITRKTSNSVRAPSGTPPVVVLDGCDSNPSNSPRTSSTAGTPVISNVTSLNKPGFVVVNSADYANIFNPTSAGEMTLGTPGSAIVASPSTSVSGTSGSPQFVLKNKVPGNQVNQVVNIAGINTANVQDESGRVTLANCTVHFNFYPNQ